MPRDFAEVEAFAGRIGRAEQALHTAAQVLRADKQRLDGFVPQFDQASGLAGYPRRQFVSLLRVSFHCILESLARFFDGSHPAVCPAC